VTAPVRLASLAATLAIALVPVAAHAARRARPLFEPTDVELEKAGTAELDLSFGFVEGGEAGRVVMPDFELDLGLLPHLELDLDGAFAIEGPPSGGFSFDHTAPDSLWLALKGGFDSVGLQVGPKLPTAPGTHGLGVEAVALGALRAGPLELALNLGGFREPRPSSGPASSGLEAGLDLDVDVTQVWSLTGELAAVRFFTAEPTQLSATAGVTWSAGEHLELSIVGLVGVGGNADRYGILLGVSPKVRLWR
jgi:hypothetical protein